MGRGDGTDRVAGGRFKSWLHHISALQLGQDASPFCPPPISSPRSHHWSHLTRQLRRLGHLLTVKCCQGFHLPQPQSAIHLNCTKWCPSLPPLWEGAVGKSMPVTISAVVHPPWHPMWRGDGTSKQLCRMRNQERRCQSQGLFPWYQEGQAVSYAKDQG